MNDAWGYEGNNEQSAGHNDGPKALRDAYEALKKQNDELNGKLTSFFEDQQKQKVSSVFESLGVPDAAKLYTGEPDPEKAKAWVESMRGVFGTGNAQGGNSEVVPAEPVLDGQTQQQFQQMTEAGQGGAPVGNFQAAEAAIGNADSIESLIAAFASAQGQNG